MEPIPDDFFFHLRCADNTDKHLIYDGTMRGEYDGTQYAWHIEGEDGRIDPAQALKLALFIIENALAGKVVIVHPLKEAERKLKFEKQKVIAHPVDAAGVRITLPRKRDDSAVADKDGEA